MKDLIQSVPEFVELDTRTTRHLTRFIHISEEAHRKGGILKSQLKDLKGYANILMEEVWKRYVQYPSLNHRELEGSQDLYWLSRPEAHKIKSVRKNLDALKLADDPELQGIRQKGIELLSYFEGFANEIDLLKSMIKTQAELKNTDPARKQDFQKPQPSRHVVDQINAALTESLSGVGDTLVRKIKPMMSRVIDEYFALVDMDARQKRKNSPFYIFQGNAFARDIATALLEDHSKPWDSEGNGVYAKISGYEERLNKMASDKAKRVVQAFVGKQIQKIPGVVESLGRTTELSVSVNARHPIEGSVSVKMENGSSFDARTQVVFGVSKNGVFFSRYPTTFHNVHGPGAKFIGKMLSEKQMYDLARPGNSPAP